MLVDAFVDELEKIARSELEKTGSTLTMLEKISKARWLRELTPSINSKRSISKHYGRLEATGYRVGDRGFEGKERARKLLELAEASPTSAVTGKPILRSPKALKAALRRKRARDWRHERDSGGLNWMSGINRASVLG